MCYDRNTNEWDSAHLKWAEWTDTYGPVISVRTGSSTAVIIGRLRAAIDIMEHHGAALVDRPANIAAGAVRLFLIFYLINYGLMNVYDLGTLGWHENPISTSRNTIQETKKGTTCAPFAEGERKLSAFTNGERMQLGT